MVIVGRVVWERGNGCVCGGVVAVKGWVGLRSGHIEAQFLSFPEFRVSRTLITVMIFIIIIISIVIIIVTTVVPGSDQMFLHHVNAVTVKN